MTDKIETRYGLFHWGNRSNTARTCHNSVNFNIDYFNNTTHITRIVWQWVAVLFFSTVRCYTLNVCLSIGNSKSGNRKRQTNQSLA